MNQEMHVMVVAAVEDEVQQMVNRMEEKRVSNRTAVEN